MWRLYAICKRSDDHVMFLFEVKACGFVTFLSYVRVMLAWHLYTAILVSILETVSSYRHAREHPHTPTRATIQRGENVWEKEVNVVVWLPVTGLLQTGTSVRSTVFSVGQFGERFMLTAARRSRCPTCAYWLELRKLWQAMHVVTPPQPPPF